MSANTAYLDTSAFLKLLVVEPEADPLRDALARWPERTSATLLRTETVRALRRSGNEHLVGAARRLMGAVHLIRLDEPLLDWAADLNPRGLRPLDAIHLASALSIGPDLGVLFTYDQRLSDAAISQGMIVGCPR